LSTARSPEPSTSSCTESYLPLTQSIDRVEEELGKLGDIADRYEKAVLHIEDLKSIVSEVSLVNPRTNLNFIVQNQARLIKSLPELHALR